MSNTLNVEHIAVDALRPNAFNTNVVSPDNESKLEESIRRLGMFKPVIARELHDGTLEIIGGEHRAGAAKRMGIKTVPVINLGRIDDNKAKEISLVDNGRYGTDDTLQLAQLLEELGNADELASFMPYSDNDLATIFASVNIALDDLDLPDDEEKAPSLKEKPIQAHQIVRFKIPVDDASWLTSLVEKTMKAQKFTESDSLTNAGDALVYLLGQANQE
ncbi:MAG: ParB/RepB/Spo0J family partition protein [Betaproteobacteria bacterium]|nr:ParB/RepB/Spo0J family partition protein [Betaproteobacteria bacterium]